MVSLLEVAYTCYRNSLKLYKNHKRVLFEGFVYLAAKHVHAVYQCFLVSITLALHDTSFRHYLPYL